MKLEQARRFALSLPEAEEEPHFELWSFRVKGKIFATGPADGHRLRIFSGGDEARSVAAADPSAFEELWWGKRLSGVEVDLRRAHADMVFVLLEDAWRRKAPKAVALRISQRAARSVPAAREKKR
jgi:hypothetical protein